MLSLLLSTVVAQTPLVVKLPAGPLTSEKWSQAMAQVQKGRKDGQRAKVVLAKGVHRLAKGLQITESNLDVVGETGAEISLAYPITRWSPVTDPETLKRIPESVRGLVREVRIPGEGDLPSFGRRGFMSGARASHAELVFDQKPATPARYPNVTGQGSMEKEGWLLTEDVFEKSAFVSPNARPSSWASFEDVWAYGYWHFDWADSHEPIASFDSASRRVNFGPENPSEGSALKSFGLTKGRRFFFYNVLEELDQPGEYWIDARNRRIVAYPPPGAKSAEVSIQSEPVIEVKGSEGVTISNLTISGSRGDAIVLDNTTSCTVDRCQVLNAGKSGIVAKDGLLATISATDISGCGQSGIVLSGGDRKTLKPSGHRVTNCVIEKVSRWNRTYNPGILVDGVGQVVTGTTIKDLPHTAILFGGNDHLFEKNLVERVCTETADAGAFYIGRNFTTRGTLIRWNRFRDVQVRSFTEGNLPLVISVYLDDCQAGISVKGNIFESKGMGILLGGGRDNTIEGNIFLESGPAIMVDARAKSWAKPNFESSWGYQQKIDEMPVTSPIWKERYPELYAALANKDDLTYPAGNRIANNVSLGGKWMQYLDNLTEKDFTYIGNVVREKPGTLEEAMALRPLGETRIPVADIGAKRPLPRLR